jgi:16S rRNA G966 N2-methylase RsmD
MHEKVLSRALRVLKPNGMIYMESPKEMDISFLKTLGLEIIRESMTGNVAYRLLALKED